MKKNIFIILIVIGVIGAVVYLLKDKLIVPLGEKVEGEVVKEGVFGRLKTALTEAKGGFFSTLLGWITQPKGIPEGIKKPPLTQLNGVAGYAAASELLGADVVGVIIELYPPVFEHRPILLRLKAYLTGQPVTVQLPRIDLGQLTLYQPQWKG